MKTAEEVHELMAILIAAVRVIEPDDGELAARVANHALGIKRRWLKELDPRTPPTSSDK